jgi:hypothetical protein
MNDPGVVAALGIETVQWLSEGAETVTVQVSGRWPRRRPTWSGQPLLVIEALGQRYRFPAMPEPPSLTGTAPGTWRMNFSVPAGLAEDPEARAWLQLGATLVPLPRSGADTGSLGGDPSAPPSEARLRSAELELKAATARAVAAEGAAGELAGRVNRLEREAQQLATLLAERERGLREAEQRAYAEEMVRLEVARERDVSVTALQRARARVRELEAALERLRRRADEAEHAAAAAARPAGGRSRARDSAARAAVLGAEAARAAFVRDVSHGSAAAPRSPRARLPPPPVWSQRERQMRAARTAGAGAASTQLTSTLEALRDELTELRQIAEREREQRIASEAAAAELGERLRAYEARSRRAYDAIDELRDQLDAVRVAYGGLVAAPPASGDLSVGEAPRVGPVERERLEAALTRLRESTPPAEEAEATRPPAEDTAVEPAPALPSRPGKPWLGPVFRRLAERDPARAGEILLALLPVQGAVHPEPLTYDVLLGPERSVRVRVSYGGATRVTESQSAPDPSDAAFRVLGDAAAVARLVAAGVPRRRLFGRGRGLARVQGSRLQARALVALSDAPLGLNGLLAAGARLDPSLLLTLAAGMIDPAWTRGETFTIAHREPDSAGFDAALRVTSAGAATTDPAALSEPPDAVIVAGRDGLAALLEGGDPPGATVQGDATAFALVLRWLKRAQSG